MLYILALKRGLIHTRLMTIKDFISSARGILHIGLPAAGANMLTPVAAAVLTAIVANYGASAVAAFGVGSRIESIACLVVLALSMTLPPFISQNLGAGNIKRVEEGYKTSVQRTVTLEWADNYINKQINQTNKVIEGWKEKPLMPIEIWE